MIDITEHLLSPGEYLSNQVKKDTIFIHHTAGSHRPDWTIDGWEHDRAQSGARLPVAVAWVIGGISTTDRNTDFDGKIYKAFDDQYWAYHLGLSTANNTVLNSKSIGIEICNYGPIAKAKDGTFLNYVNKPIPADMVEALPIPFRGYSYYHKYTPNQLAALKELIQMIARKYNIDVKAGLPQFVANGASAFEINQACLKGVPGLWTHTNCRADKFDCFPQPQLTELLKAL